MKKDEEAGEVKGKKSRRHGLYGTVLRLGLPAETATLMEEVSEEGTQRKGKCKVARKPCLYFREIDRACRFTDVEYYVSTAMTQSGASSLCNRSYFAGAT